MAATTAFSTPPDTHETALVRDGGDTQRSSTDANCQWPYRESQWVPFEARENRLLEMETLGRIGTTDMALYER
jgi:hypothetical protein